MSSSSRRMGQVVTIVTRRWSYEERGWSSYLHAVLPLWFLRRRCRREDDDGDNYTLLDECNNIICWRRKASLFSIIIDNSDGKSVTKYWNDDHQDNDGQVVDDDRLPKVYYLLEEESEFI